MEKNSGTMTKCVLYLQIMYSFLYFLDIVKIPLILRLIVYHLHYISYILHIFNIFRTDILNLCTEFNIIWVIIPTKNIFMYIRSAAHNRYIAILGRTLYNITVRDVSTKFLVF